MEDGMFDRMEQEQYDWDVARENEERDIYYPEGDDDDV